VKLIEQLKGKLLIILDLDDTILATIDFFYDLAVSVCDELSLNIFPKEQLKHFWGQPLNDILLALAQKNKWSREDTQRFIKLFRQKLDTNIVPLIPDAARVLKNLKEEGFILTLLTNRSKKNLEPLDDHGLNNGFFYIIVCKDTYPGKKTRKPNPEVMNLILKGFGFSTDKIIFVGDSAKFDLPVAQAQGIDFLAVTTGASNEGDFTKKNLPKENILPSIASLLED